MTPTAWGQGATNALICGSILLTGCLLIAAVISSVSHRSFGESFWLAWVFLCGLILLLFLVTWVYGLNAGGRILLDCGPHPTRVGFLINGALFVVLGLGGLFVMRSLPNTSALVMPVLGVCFGVYWLVMATGRLQIREGGIWQYWALLRWDKIEALRWSGDSTLLVKAKSRLPFFGHGALPVPPEQMQAINELLQKYCPVWDRHL
jgi:hypothetical protein